MSRRGVPVETGAASILLTADIIKFYCLLGDNPLFGYKSH